MATALKVFPTAPAACCHADFVEYVPSTGGYPDDTITQKGRCISCNGFYELWVSVATGEIYHERMLTTEEIRSLRQAEMRS